MYATDRTLDDLGFEQIRRALSARCRCEPGKARALARPFLPSHAEIEPELFLIEQARQLRAEPLALPLSGIGEIRPLLERASKGALLEPSELIAITGALFSFERTREALEERRERLPALAAIGRQLPELERLATRLDRCFESSGEISDRASPELKEARDRARGLHRAIKARLDRMLHDEKFVASLREPYFSVRHDRYVLPVNAQHRGLVPGIVHNASQSGQTLFVEPQELIGQGNDLAIAQSLVLEEERRVLLELSNAVGRHAEEIATGIEAIARLDEAEAAARLADELEAAPPSLQPADGALELLSLRHPLLALRSAEVVPNDVGLSHERRGLIVSGPNAGGKTVTLTAVGLCALMARAGLPVPAARGSRLPLFGSVHSAVGDAQDLAQGLSTFSAHVAQLKRICEESGKGSLVLIDEIAADTDPKEGAAIAIAVLEELISRGALVLVTTHLEELKALAHLDRRFLNARVGFDPKKMAPTYRLRIGEAGSSSAIEIAARVGLPEAICARARELALGSGGTLARALATVELERHHLEEERQLAQQEAKAAEALKKEHATVLEALENRRREQELRYRDGLAAELEFAQRQVRELLNKLKASGTAEQARRAAKEIADRLEEQRRGARALRVELEGPKAAPGPLELKPGAMAHHLGLGQDVEILELDEDEVVVQAGPLRTRAKRSELVAPKKPRQATRIPEAPSSKLKKAEEAAPAPLTLSAPSCDVRGLRLDEALRSVDQFLDRVLREGEAEARILHGHGTGALKQAIRQHLADSPYVRVFRPGESHEGGDGVTFVTLRG